jgi:16S rRNA (guanine(966)-N(2))-methyltransferase RsmD
MTLKIIAGKFKGRILKTRNSPQTRPTQGMLREAVFNICQNEIENARFLDLFAGSGAMGLEALSRGASHATFVEQNRQAIQCIKENIALLQLQNNATLLPMDCSRALSLLPKASFDLIYIDPPYEQPIPLEQIAPLLAPSGTLFIEERHDPKKPHQPKTAPHLHLKETRRFGIALLSIFHYK